MLVVLLLFILVLTACDENPPRPSAPEAERVEDFALLDHEGRFHRLYYHADAELIVIYVQGNDCPIARHNLPALKRLRDRYSERGVRFFMLNANLQDQREDIAREAVDFGIDIPILVDESQIVAEALDVSRTGEAIVIAPEDWRIVYRGPVDDRLNYEFQKAEASERYLRDAIRSHLDDEPIERAERPLLGCIVPIGYASRQDISYSRDVAPVLLRKCAICHHEGGIAPWAMSDYAKVRGWAPMMREVIRTRRMPPWQADPHIGEFSNDVSLMPEETATIVRWIEAGAPKSPEEPDPLAEADAGEGFWPLGEPDLRVELPEQEVPETGLIEYRYFELPVPVAEDTWVQAVDFKPRNRKVLHHGFVFLIPPGPEGVPPEVARLDAADVFATYTPGFEPEWLPPGTGRFMPAQSRFVVELHYTATGRPEQDRPVLGIYLAEEPPAHQLRVVGLWNDQIEIPPRARDYTAEAHYRFEREAVLHGIMAHMHYRGSHARFTAHYPDGRTETLLSLPNYNFNWQRYYQLAEPKHLPAGTRITMLGGFDNSARNPLNPDPEKTVRWGGFSTDEMLAGYLTYHHPR